MKWLTWLINDRSNEAMICRTLVEALLSWGIANLTDIVGLFNMSGNAKALLTSMLMVILTWAIGLIRGKEM